MNAKEIIEWVEAQRFYTLRKISASYAKRIEKFINKYNNYSKDKFFER